MFTTNNPQSANTASINSLKTQAICDCVAETQAPCGRINLEPRPTGGVVSRITKTATGFTRGSTVCHPKGLRNSCGHTMIELLLAIVVTAMVSTVIFAAYLGIQKQFGKNQSNANTVFEMVNTKNKLNKIFSEVYEVEEIYSNKVYYKTIDNKTQNVISYFGNEISQNGKTVISDIKSFKLEIASEKDNYAVLLYSAYLNKHCWIGGSAKVFIK